MAGDDLYWMLGLPVEAAPLQVHETYEAAMADAARSHNFRRAAQLSAAFDRLPHSIRESIYPTRGRPTSYARPRPPARGNRRTRGATTSSWPRIRWLPPIATAVVLGVLVAHHFGIHPHGGTTQPSPPPPQEAAAPTQSIGSITETIGTPVGSLIRNYLQEWEPPPNAVTDSNGATLGQCVPEIGGAASHLLAVSSGSLMVCPKGFLGFYRVSDQ